MVSKPVGVWTAWCVSVENQDNPEDAIWHEQSLELRGCIVIVIAEQITREKQQYTSQGKEGELAYPVT